MNKDYEQYLDGSQGLYYKSAERLWEGKLLRKSIAVAGQAVVPGNKTTLNGFFCRPIEYLGVEENGYAIFYIGSQNDLFAQANYYEPVLVVSDTRLFKMYSENAGRDFNFINQKWI